MKIEKIRKKTAIEKAREKKGYYYAAGKRKTSIATVRLYPFGTGIVTVNGKPLEEYFKLPLQKEIIFSPLKIAGHLKSFDITVKVCGGGLNSQAQAIRHGIAKALVEYNSELKLALRKIGFLTHDARIKERKKPGLKRARKAPQWQKR